jgi:hypothetical protein
MSYWFANYEWCIQGFDLLMKEAIHERSRTVGVDCLDSIDRYADRRTLLRLMAHDADIISYAVAGGVYRSPVAGFVAATW